MTDSEDRLKRLEDEIERRLVERFAALRDEFDRLRLESDRRWAGFLDRFEQKLSGIVPVELMTVEPQEKAMAGVVPAQAARSLDDASNQVEALHRFLDLCLGYASRAALLVTRGGSVGVWKAVGFTDRGGSDETARKAMLHSEPGSALARVLEGQPCELPPGNEISAALSAGDASRAVLIAMVVKEKISGALYADCVVGEEGRFDPDALGFLTFLAGLIVDRLALRKLKPAPALCALESAPTPAPPAPPPAPAAEPEFELAEEPSEPEAEAPEPPRAPAPELEGDYGTQMTPSVTAPTPAAPRIPPPPQFYGLPPEEEPQRPTQAPFGRPSADAEEPAILKPEPPRLELAPEPEEPPTPGTTMRIPSSIVEAGLSAEPEPIRPMPLPPPAPAPRPSTGARRLAGPLAPLEGDERREEARRFAKLLVSEIKLYNEKAVAQGREQGNIYELLKEDIDRSRQMYDERIPEDVRAGSNFFYEELVRILADGRSDSLGL